MSNEKLGPTNRFPQGKLNEHDEGALVFAVGEQQDKVVINFATPVAFLGMTAQQAVGMASLLVKHARSVARRTGEVIRVEL